MQVDEAKVSGADVCVSAQVVVHVDEIVDGGVGDACASVRAVVHVDMVVGIGICDVCVAAQAVVHVTGTVGGSVGDVCVTPQVVVHGGLCVLTESADVVLETTIGVRGSSCSWKTWPGKFTMIRRPVMVRVALTGRTATTGLLGGLVIAWTAYGGVARGRPSVVFGHRNRGQPDGRELIAFGCCCVRPSIKRRR